MSEWQLKFILKTALEGGGLWINKMGLFAGCKSVFSKWDISLLWASATKVTFVLISSSVVDWLGLLCIEVSYWGVSITAQQIGAFWCRVSQILIVELACLFITWSLHQSGWEEDTMRWYNILMNTTPSANTNPFILVVEFMVLPFQVLSRIWGICNAK